MTMNPSNEKINKTNLENREVLDPSEDSGFGSIAETLVPPAEKMIENREVTIGEGIKFCESSSLQEEIKIKKIRNQEEAEKRRQAEEAYNEEIREKQYKRLMHLLTKSKGLANFMLKQIETSPSVPIKKGTIPQKRRIVSDSENDENFPPPKKTRGRPRKQTSEKSEKSVKSEKKGGKKGGKMKVNLSVEEIEKQLSQSDGENDNNDVNDENNENNENNEKLPSDFVVPKYFEGTLRDYQKEGLNWLKVLYENGLNGILADEMGLGKTIQVIALITHLVEKQIPGPYLIIAPLSTITNWLNEFKRFAPKLPVFIFHGDQAARNTIKPQIRRKHLVSDSFKTLPIVITSYEVPKYEANFLRTQKWRYIIVDEAQRIKNYKCQLITILKSLRSINRLLLTGTPLQNDLSELWSLLNFLLPDIFNDLGVFESWFNVSEVIKEGGRNKILKQEQEKNVLATLREILQPFMLRRLKELVCPDIPPHKEVLVYAPLTEIQYTLYKATLKRDLSVLHIQPVENVIVDDENGVRPKRSCTKRKNINQLYNDCLSDTSSVHSWSETASDIIMEDHTFNFNVPEYKDLQSEIQSTAGTCNYNKPINERNIDMWKDFAEVTDSNKQYFIHLAFGNRGVMFKHIVNHPYLIHYPLNDCGLPLIDPELINVSGKLLVLDAMLKKLKQGGHKILLFSTFTSILDIIEDYLTMRKDYLYLRLDGNRKEMDRVRDVEMFNSDPNIFLFLITTKAGGVGLNLAAADTVIIYDSDWNPQNDLQAMARCHRIGQTKPVVVYRLCTKGTIDESIIKRADSKRVLEKMVISKNLIKDCTSEGSLQDLIKLLDESGYESVHSKNEIFTDAELDKLLDRGDLERFQKERLEALEKTA